MNFPYQVRDGQSYPIIRVTLIHKNLKMIIVALVDSGANLSVFTWDVAKNLGIIVESGKKIFLGGVGGRIMGYEHVVDMELANKSFRAKIVFSREFLVSFNLLGREDVFSRFMICFDEKRKLVELKSS